MRRPEGWDGFHLVCSPSIRVSKWKTLYPPRFYQFNIESALAQYIPHRPLFTPRGLPLHKMRFIIIHVVGHKITDKIAAGINYSVCCSFKKKKKKERKEPFCCSSLQLSFSNKQSHNPSLWLCWRLEEDSHFCFHYVLHVCGRDTSVYSILLVLSFLLLPQNHVLKSG